MEEELSLETSDVADGWVGPTKKAMGARGSKASLYLTFLILIKGHQIPLYKT
jgi:hypothetical protein